MLADFKFCTVWLCICRSLKLPKPDGQTTDLIFMLLLEASGPNSVGLPVGLQNEFQNKAQNAKAYSASKSKYCKNLGCIPISWTSILSGVQSACPKKKNARKKEDKLVSCLSPSHGNHPTISGSTHYFTIWESAATYLDDLHLLIWWTSAQLELGLSFSERKLWQVLDNLGCNTRVECEQMVDRLNTIIWWA